MYELKYLRKRARIGYTLYERPYPDDLWQVLGKKTFTHGTRHRDRSLVRPRECASIEAMYEANVKAARGMAPDPPRIVPAAETKAAVGRWYGRKFDRHRLRAESALDATPSFGVGAMSVPSHLQWLVDSERERRQAGREVFLKAE